ncbi:MAG: CPBP family glutamic-type intramembrane protease, partial [Actinomycetota bacterium]
VVAGLAAGALLYAATRIAVPVLSRWQRFRRHVLAMYGRQGTLSLTAALLLSLALSVPGEELFWRGLFQGELASALDGRTALAAVLTWTLFVLVNLPSGNLAAVAAAVVGGAVWVGLAWWTGGVLAALSCHVVWTGLMISLPVVAVPSRTG